ncbi:hypothetical protein [Streptomyces sp. CNQ085]|uniref:hypothetical protein n=1 Tax=Streptomyces sp. CNQ085 TaxID=2886944 RepID=UPI001F507D39|nr:hypothetical protein [Streptomyces sp. CNQ085]MCI0386199.1 hypothetical protein [Streptomyces sp. CNQ085]
MFGRRRELAAENRDLCARLATMRDQRDDAERRAASAEAAAKRTHDRNRVLTELLDEARHANGDYDLDRMEARLERALRAVARLRAENTDQRAQIRSVTDQLMHAMGYTDAELRLLGVDPEVTA